MVLFMPRDDYHTDTMTQVTELRQARALCDVTLTVGKNQIQAHGCILAARSEYFRTAFLSQFKEASTQNINLSEVTNDVQDLEQVVDFLYTGRIEINDDNLEVLVKLSTYLLIKSLRENCVRYMKDHVSLRSCLNHFFCCVGYSLDKVERGIKLVVASRLHDYFISEDRLDLTPAEVQLLLNKDMFQHCTTSDMLQFVFKWLPDELTDQHVTVAAKILDTVENKLNSSLSDQQKCESKEMIIKIEEKLHNETRSDVKIFLEKLHQISAGIFSKEETKSQLGVVMSGSSSTRPSNLPSSDCEVILTLSPKQCVVDAFNKSQGEYGVERTRFEEPIFTLCGYIPSKGSWFHIKDFETEEAMTELPKHYTQSYTIVPVLFKEDLVLICSHARLRVYFFSLRHNSWRSADMPDFECESYGERHSAFDYCAVSDNNCLYLIMKIVVEDVYMTRHSYYDDEDIPKGEYFTGFKVSEDGHIQRIFKTEIQTYDAYAYSELQAKISSVSNELIFTCGPKMPIKNTPSSSVGHSYVFLVNLNHSHPEAINLSKELTIYPVIGLTGVKILQTESHFYIVYDGSADSRHRDVRIIYAYEFDSLNLTKQLQDDNTEMSYEAKLTNVTKVKITPVNILRINQREVGYMEMFPCCEEFTASDGKSLWSFEGDRKFFSAFHEVKIEEDGKLTHKKHTPPPFSCVTRMAVGELPTDLVAQWTPVGRFLHNVSSVDTRSTLYSA